jgi:hypothetical protein
MSSLKSRHDPNKIDPHHIRVDFVLMNIHKGSPLQCSSFHHAEGIEWVSMWLVSSIAYLYKNPSLTISCDNIDLSSLDLVVTFYDLESLLTEISYCDILSGISDGAAGRSSRGHSFLYWYRMYFFKKVPKTFASLFHFCICISSIP